MRDIFEIEFKRCIAVNLTAMHRLNSIVKGPDPEMSGSVQMDLLPSTLDFRIVVYIRLVFLDKKFPLNALLGYIRLLKTIFQKKGSTKI